MKLMSIEEARFRRLWDKQRRDGVRLKIRLSSEELKELPEYSGSLPTGTTIGKRWKRNVHPKCNGAQGYPPELTIWSVGQYIDTGDPEKVGILWYDVEEL